MCIVNIFILFILFILPWESEKFSVVVDYTKWNKNNLWMGLFYVCGSVHICSILIIVQRDATQSSLFIILQVHSTCFGCQPHPSPGVHKTVTTASCTGHAVLCSYLLPTWPRWKEVAAQHSVTSTGGCSYGFVYSWWWVWLTPETCRVNLQNNK